MKHQSTTTGAICLSIAVWIIFGLIIYGDENRCFNFTYRSSYRRLVGEFFNSFIGLLKYFFEIGKTEYRGYVGFVTGVNKGWLNVKNQTTVQPGFKVCVSSNLSPLIYKIEESNQQSFLNFIAQIASLAGTIFAIFRIVFKNFEGIVYPKLVKLSKKLKKKKKD